MKEAHIKIKSIQKCLLQFLNNPSSSSAMALEDAYTEDMKIDSEWGCTDYDPRIVTVFDSLASIYIDAFYNDRTDILDILNLHLKDTDTLLHHKEIVSRLITHVKTAIMTHTHTETIMHIIVPDSAVAKLMHNDLFATAVYSENYPIAKRMQEVEAFDVDAAMMELIMEESKYGQLDILLDNGNFLQQSNLISNIICKVAETGNTDMLKWIKVLAERYSASFDGSEKAEGDFIVRNSDIDKTISNLYKYILRIFRKGSNAVLDYLTSRGIKLSNAGLAMSACAESMTDYDDTLNSFMIKALINMIGDDSYICYEDVMIKHYENNWYNNMKLLIKTISENIIQPIKLDICKKHAYYFTAENIDLLKRLLKYCEVNPVKELAADSLIEHAVHCKKNDIVNAILKTGALSSDVIEKIIEICTDIQNFKCLNLINKYCTKSLMKNKNDGTK